MSEKVQNIILSYLNGEESFDESVSKLKKEGYTEFEARFELNFYKSKFENQ